MWIAGQQTSSSGEIPLCRVSPCSPVSLAPESIGQRVWGLPAPFLPSTPVTQFTPVLLVLAYGCVVSSSVLFLSHKAQIRHGFIFIAGTEYKLFHEHSKGRSEWEEEEEENGLY